MLICLPFAACYKKKGTGEGADTVKREVWFERVEYWGVASYPLGGSAEVSIRFYGDEGRYKLTVTPEKDVKYDITSHIAAAAGEYTISDVTKTSATVRLSEIADIRYHGATPDEFGVVEGTLNLSKLFPTEYRAELSLGDNYVHRLSPRNASTGIQIGALRP